MAMGRSQPVQAYVVIIAAALFATAASANFLTDFEVTWGSGRVKVLENGELAQLTMDRASGSGFRSKHQYLFGRIDMKIKLVSGNSAGTVATYYLSSEGNTHDEVDFEFLGNVSGQPYVLHTNVYSQGNGDREQQFYLWFDPRADFHTYSILWNPQEIVFYVDGTPIRAFKNNERIGVPFPKNQPMRLYASLWDGEDWATRGGLEKTDWTQAPFVASYRAFAADACVSSSSTTSDQGGATVVANAAAAPCPAAANGNWWGQTLDAAGAQKMSWVQQKYMIYNYCTDAKRFPQGPAPECRA